MEVTIVKVTYIKLENVAGLAVGIGKESMEIDFKNSNNRIVAIRARNAKGKTTLLSSISPFAYVTSLDERSSIPYITRGKDGYKEIHYQDGKDEYVIKHYFKHSKDTHTVKSYFMKNGEELNENGNVTSFNACVETYLGLTQEMMRLVRIGTNVNSFITLTPAKRKEYIGKLIEEIETYLSIYKKINEDIRVVKGMLQANNTNLYNCHISDPVVEQENLRKLEKEIKRYEKERDDVLSKVAKLNALMKGNDVNELRRRLHEAEAAMSGFNKLSTAIKDENLESTTIEDLIKERMKLDQQKIDTQSVINSNRLMIDSLLQQIERSEVNIKRITSDTDIQAISIAWKDIVNKINSIPNEVKEFKPLGSSSQEVFQVLSRLQTFNQIGQMIYTLGNKPLNTYIRLKRNGTSVDRWLKDQAKRAMSRMNDADLKELINKVFQSDTIISPNCDEEYKECPFYRFSDTILRIKDKYEDDMYTDEELRSIQVISNNVDTILNEVDRLLLIQFPDSVKDNMREKIILDRMDHHLTFFELDVLQSYLSILREYELYVEYSKKAAEYEHQLRVYQKSGVDSYLQEIAHQKDTIEKYRSNISELQKTVYTLDSGLQRIDSKIALLTKFQESVKHRSIYEQTIKSTKAILEPMESAEHELISLNFQQQHIENLIASTRNDHNALEMKLMTYNRLLKESKVLSQKNNELTMILDAVSTKKGIPVYYMKHYLAKIQKLSNDLLQLIYGDEFQLAAFNVTPDTFEVPYIKNGKKIPDIKYASQSEIALSTMALSFALANSATDRYNILLLDEIDGGLDDTNRSAFLDMLRMQMQTLQAEQVFIISQNLGQMANIPMDCIDLSDVGMKSPLQHIIYEA